MKRGQSSFFKQFTSGAIQFSIVPVFILNFLQSLVGITPPQEINPLSEAKNIVTQTESTKVGESSSNPGQTPPQPVLPENPPGLLNREVFGFLPYWRLDQASNLRYDLLTTLAYFGVDADENGNIIKVKDSETEPGWRGWNSATMNQVREKAKENRVAVALTIKAMTNENIEGILGNSTARTNFLSQAVSELKAKGVEGLNIDFEYVGNPPSWVRDSFTDFVVEASNTLRREIPNSQLSVDVYAEGARKVKLYDVPAIAPYVDKIFIMAYDYHRPGSEQAGPVAPLYGFKEGKYYFDVSTAVEDYLKVVPAEKIILGIAYYGWDWPVENGKTPRSAKRAGPWDGYPEMKTYALTQIDEDNKEERREWDETAKSPWYWWVDRKLNTFRQVWYEDVRSLGEKYDLINRKNLAGVGIWALGYDRERPELWNLLKEKFAN